MKPATLMRLPFSAWMAAGKTGFDRIYPSAAFRVVPRVDSRSCQLVLPFGVVAGFQISFSSATSRSE
jgi:hypothetical protein